MGIAKQVANKYAIEVLEIYSTELIASNNFFKFLDACKNENLVIIGIDGFKVEGKSITPEMNAIADFSDLRDSETSILASARFFSDVNDSSLFYDFTIL